MEICNTVMSTVEKANLPEDVKQDFYVKWLEMDALEFPTDGQLKAYIFKALKNDNLNKYFQEQNRARLREENHEQIIANLGMNDFPDDPADIAADREDILIKLNGLSAALRDTLIQYYIEGRTPEEIAATNYENVEAVRKRITRARNQLQEIDNGR